MHGSTNIISQSQALSWKNFWSAVDAMNDWRAVRKDTHAGPQRIPSADVPSCGQKRHTRWPATNASACNELLARNEFQVLMCHHAVRKDTHAGLQRMLRHAMNYGCGTQPVLTREFCQITNASACELAPAWTSKQQSDFINYQVLESLRFCV